MDDVTIAKLYKSHLEQLHHAWGLIFEDLRTWANGHDAYEVVPDAAWLRARFQVMETEISQPRGDYDPENIPKALAEEIEQLEDSAEVIRKDIGSVYSRALKEGLDKKWMRGMANLAFKKSELEAYI